MAIRAAASFKAGDLQGSASALLGRSQDIFSRAFGGEDVEEEIVEKAAVADDVTEDGLDEPTESASLDDYLDAAFRYFMRFLPIRMIDIERKTFVTRGDVVYPLKDSLVTELKAAPKSDWRGILLEKVPPKIKFAIFSHRWGGSEPLYAQANEKLKEWLSHSEKGEKYDEGIEKLRQFCATSLGHGITLAWSDTCCIDKTSSAELQESINSMFQWYRASAICIVHLIATPKLPAKGASWSDPWFKRGWTLQELVAPRRLLFYSTDWKLLNPASTSPDANDKTDDGFMQRVSDATRIPVKSIQDFTPGTDGLRDKLTWVAPRATTREEDMSYCLVGIFDVEMSINYGEGAEKAFFRLQSAIIEKTSDRSLFNWWNSHGAADCTLLAKAPSNFVPIDVPALDQPVQIEASVIAKIACPGFICCGLCLETGVSMAVQFDILRTTGMVLNSSEEHHTLTNSGLKIKVETIRVLHRYRLLPKDGYQRWYLTMYGYKRAKVCLLKGEKEKYVKEGEGSLIVVPLTDEKISKEKGCYPRIGVLLHKIGENRYKRIQTRDPIVLMRDSLSLKNKDAPHHIYVA